MDEKENLEELWNKYVVMTKQYKKMRQKLLSKCGYDKGEPIVDILRKALSKPEEKYIALEVAQILTAEAQQELFDDLLPFAIELETKSSINKAEEIILSLPKEWLISKLREKAKAILQS